MGTLLKKVVTRAMPNGATTITLDGRTIAQWKDRKGKKRSAEVTVGRDGSPRIKTEAATWTAKYRDGENLVQEVATRCRDKQAAMAVLNDLMKRAEQVRAKVLSPAQDRISDHARASIEEHIEAFLEYQRQKGTHPDRVKGYETKLYETTATCKFRTLCDLSVDRLEKWLAGQQSGERNLSASLYNSYREAWLAFGNWCIGKRTSRKQTHFNGEKRLIANPFEGMTRLNEQMERRRRARALTEGELIKLLNAAKARPLVHARTVYRGQNKGQLLAKVTDDRRRELDRLGRERAMIYKTLVLTGLRVNELRTLTIGDLSFGDIPFIKLRHSNEKNRQGSTVALRTDLAADLRQWTNGRERDDRVFQVPAGILRILNRDLAAAGIAKTVDDCVVHIHALRHSFGTHLSMAGVAPRVAQAAMRHSNISLTMGTYTDARLLDTAGAVERLPFLPLGGASGESPAGGEQRVVAPMVAPTPGHSSISESIPDPGEAEDRGGCRQTKTPQNTSFYGVFGDGRYRTRICDLHDVNVAL